MKRISTGIQIVTVAIIIGLLIEISNNTKAADIAAEEPERIITVGEELGITSDDITNNAIHEDMVSKDMISVEVAEPVQISVVSEAVTDTSEFEFSRGGKWSRGFKPSAIIRTEKADKYGDEVYTELGTMKYMRMTAYTWTGNKMANGEYPYEGVCAARKEDIGKTAIIYDLSLNKIGEFEIKDTGSHKRIKNGTCVDVYRSSKKACYDWAAQWGDDVLVQIVE